MREIEEQEAVVEYCELKSIPIVHIPNEGKRSYSYGAQLKRAGMQKGFPDLFIPVPSQEKHGLFIELKIGRNKPTSEQLSWLRRLKNNGYECFVCYGSGQAIECIEFYLAEK